MIFSLNTQPTAAQAYNNVAAHNEVLAMMKRGERLAMFFAIDKDSYESVRIESCITQRFSYQINEESLNWLIGYLTAHKVEDAAVDPSKLNKAEETSSDDFRKDMLKEFVKAKLGNIQIRPAFLDRTGRLTATATFKHGTILFFTERDTEIEEFLQENKLIG